MIGLSSTLVGPMFLRVLAWGVAGKFSVVYLYSLTAELFLHLDVLSPSRASLRRTRRHDVSASHIAPAAIRFLPGFSLVTPADGARYYS